MFDDMSNIKASLYNAFFIVLVVIALVPLVKFAANKYPIPGFTPLVNAV